MGTKRFSFPGPLVKSYIMKEKRENPALKKGQKGKGPFIFYEHGGAGGIWLIATSKLYDPPLACNFFPHGPPPSRTIFF